MRPEHRDWITAEERVGPADEHLMRDLARGVAVTVVALLLFVLFR